MALLSAHNISKNFGGLKALSDISFEVSKGEILGLMGANGAGKTTLFSVIAGHVSPSAGRVMFNGRDITGLRPDRVCRAGVCRTFQIVRPFPGLSVHENAAVSALFGSEARTSPGAAAAAADAALEAVGLEASRSHPAASLTLSGQKRLEIARALASGAELIMLDEVMAGLNPSEVDEMVQVLIQLRDSRGLTFVIVEHVMGALMKLSDNILVLDHGERIAYGKPKEIADDARVSEAYFG